MNILVTGAGGPAAISFMQALVGIDAKFFMADMDFHAAGLYLVPAPQRIILRAGLDPEFVPDLLRLCVENQINVLVPTVDVELAAIARARRDFESAGVRLMLASPNTLTTCLDKLNLLIACEGRVPVPAFAVFNENFDDTDWEYPLIVKPREGSGSRGIVKVDSPEELARIERGSHLLVQEYLPGEEYSVDVVADSNGEIMTAVPRVRMKVDSGIAVMSRTVHDAELEEFARTVARLIGLTYTANIQFRRNASGTPCLLEVNPRFPGTMPLTVASGVNMPLICLKEILGQPIAETELQWRELAMVRTWQETYLAAEDIFSLEKRSTAAYDPSADIDLFVAAA